jgi:hydrogenase maturation protein HypF
VTFEGQAAIWLERLARSSSPVEAYPFPLTGAELDFRPLLDSLAKDRLRGRIPEECARAFQKGMAVGLATAVTEFCDTHTLDTVAFSGGVFQNELLLEDLKELLAFSRLTIWTNRIVPPNDGGISLGQAALAAFAQPCTSFR